MLEVDFAHTRTAHGPQPGAVPVRARLPAPVETIQKIAYKNAAQLLPPPTDALLLTCFRHDDAAVRGRRRRPEDRVPAVGGAARVECSKTFFIERPPGRSVASELPGPGGTQRDVHPGRRRKTFNSVQVRLKAAAGIGRHLEPAVINLHRAADKIIEPRNVLHPHVMIQRRHKCVDTSGRGAEASVSRFLEAAQQRTAIRRTRRPVRAR